MSSVTNAPSIPSSSNILNPGISSNLRNTFLTAAISIKSVCERPQTIIAIGGALCITGTVLLCVTTGVIAIVGGAVLGAGLGVGAVYLGGHVLHGLKRFCSGSKKSNDSAKLEKPSAPPEVLSSSSSNPPSSLLPSKVSPVSLILPSPQVSSHTVPLAPPETPSCSKDSFSCSTLFYDLSENNGIIIERTRKDFEFLMKEIHSIDKDGNLNYQKISMPKSTRDIYINHNTGVGFKVFVGESAGLMIDKFRYTDLRLNDIYYDDEFYEGRYKEQIDYQVINFYEDGVRKIFNSVTKFKIIPGFENLSEDELIPRTTIKMLKEMGYIPHDIKSTNYIKVKHNDTYDYIPIDAKYIGRLGSDTFRTRLVNDLREVDIIYKNRLNKVSFIDETK